MSCYYGVLERWRRQYTLFKTPSVWRRYSAQRLSRMQGAPKRGQSRPSTPGVLKVLEKKHHPKGKNSKESLQGLKSSPKSSTTCQDYLTDRVCQKGGQCPKNTLLSMDVASGVEAKPIQLLNASDQEQMREHRPQAKALLQQMDGWIRMLYPWKRQKKE